MANNIIILPLNISKRLWNFIQYFNYYTLILDILVKRGAHLLGFGIFKTQKIRQFTKSEMIKF